MPIIKDVIPEKPEVPESFSVGGHVASIVAEDADDKFTENARVM